MLWVFLVWCLGLAPAWAAEPPPAADCSNPRVAADNLFIWQADDRWNPTLAAACLDVPAGRDPAKVAIHLRQVLDARALYVPVSTLPVDPNWVGEDGDAHVLPLPDAAPWLVLERQPDGAWRYSRRTVEQVPELYASTFSVVSRWFQSALPPVFHQKVAGLAPWQYLYALLLVTAGLLLGLLLRVLVLGQARRVLGRANVPVDANTLARLRTPVTLIALGGVVLWGVSDLQLSVGLSQLLYVVFTVVLGLSGILLVSRMVDVGAGVASGFAARTESRLDDQLIPLGQQAARVLVWVVGTLFVLQNTGVQVWSFVAGLGIGSLAFALAAQDSVANLFGALNIFLDKPFQIGDWVKIGDVEGTVEEVGFRSFRVRTFYNSLVTIPNSVITKSNVDNLGVRPRRRVKLTLGLTYDTPPDRVQAYVEGVRAILAAHPLVQRTYEVHLYELGASALQILVYYHLVTPTWSEELEARSQNLLEFIRLAGHLGVSFAFPSQSLYIEATPERPLQPHPPTSTEDLEAAYSAFGPGGAQARPGGVPFHKGFSVAARSSRGEAG